MSPTVIALMLAVSLFAGWVDAVVGGGGLILLPLIMILNPSFTYAQALGVNKIAAICGTGSSAITMVRRVPAGRAAFRYAPLAFVGAALGAVIASSVDKDIMRPIVIVLLVSVGTFVLLRPSFGQVTVRRTVTRRRWVAALMLITVLGFYDGAFGPGTGLFLILTITSLLGEDFVTSAAWAKILKSFSYFHLTCYFAISAGQRDSVSMSITVNSVATRPRADFLRTFCGLFHPVTDRKRQKRGLERTVRATLATPHK